MDDYKGIEHLRLAEAPEPVPQAGEVVLKVQFAGLNPADRYLSQRLYPAKPALPHILGRDGVGTVVRVGAGVEGLAVGDRRSILRGDVGVNRAGTFAEWVAVPTDNLVETPADWTGPEAGGATLVYLTAYQALTTWGPLPPASVVLVTGASGGVGVAAVQLARAMGCRVVALSRSAEKSGRLKQLGAELTCNPEDPKWRQAVKAQLAPRGVDLAIDNIGGALLPQLIDTLGNLGRVSVVGRLAGPVPEFNTATLFFRRLRIGGVAVGAYTNAESRAAWKHVLELLAAAGQRPVVDRVFPFEQLREAFARLAAGPLGKVLVQM